MDIVTLGAALSGSKAYTDQVTQSLTGSDIGLAGYTKGTVAKQDVSPTDNINQGLGKIEKRVSDNENNISLKANTADVNTTTTNLQTQIDQIAQAAGSGTADTEVAQARVGADGTSYQTLKARLDGENSELKEDLSALNKVAYTIIEGKYVSALTGKFNENNSYNTIVFAIDKSMQIKYYSKTNETYPGYGFYSVYPQGTADGFISGSPATIGEHDLTIPQNAKYIAMSYRTAELTAEEVFKCICNVYNIAFTAYKAKDDVASLNDFSEAVKNLVKINPDIIQNKYASSVTGKFVDSEYYNIAILPVIEGDVYSYNGLYDEQAAGYALYKGNPSENSGIFISGGAGTAEPQNIVIPQGVDYAAFSYRKNSSGILNNLLKYTGNLYHISKQLSLLGTKISSINPDILKNNGTYVPDKYISGTTGDISSWTQGSGVYGYSEYMVASGGVVTYIADRNESQAGYAFYDYRGVYISGGLGTKAAQTLTVPEGATIGRFTTTNPTNVIVLTNVFDVLSKLMKASYQAPLPSLVLPADSIAVVGHEYNIFYDNVIDGYTDQYYLDARITDITNSTYVLSDCIRILPTSSDIGTHTLTIRLMDRITRTIIDSKTVNLHVIADSSLVNKKVLFIGDSLTDAGYYPAEIQHNLSNGGIISLGTRQDTVTIGGQNLTVNHEGRAGWATYDYTESSSRSGVSNAFWDGEKFNFSYYMQQQGYSSVDAVCIGLGTNGGDTQRMYDAMDTMISSIREYSQTVKILIALTCPPASQDGCGKNNHTQSSAELKHNFLNVVRKYIEKYQNTNDVNLDVIELYFHLDTVHDFPTITENVSARNPLQITRQNNNVHPSVYGYLHFADAYYNRLLYHLAN